MPISVLRTVSARDNWVQDEQCLYKRVTFDTPLIQNATGKVVYVGVLPQNSLKRDTIVRVNTSFNGTLVIGTSSNIRAFATSDDISSASPPDTYVADTGYGTLTTAADVPVYVTLTTATTVGEADIWITYLKAR
jgi:hypothetical protein